MDESVFGPCRPDVGNIDDDQGHIVAHHIENRADGVAVDVEITVDHAAGGKQAQLVVAFGQEPVEQGGVDALGRTQGVGDAHAAFLIEVQTRGAEGQIEIGDDGFGIVAAGDQPADVVGDGARADAALGADEGDDPADRLRLGIVVEVRNHLDHLQEIYGGDEVFAHSLAHQLPVQNDIVDVADHDDFGRRVAYLR